MGTDLLIGVDVGTYETKGVATTVEGEVVARAAHGHRMATPRPGWAEHDPERDWWDGVCSVIAGLLADDAVSAEAVVGLGVSAIGPCVVAADADGNALRPAILYGVDTRATSQMATIEERLGRDALLSRCGNVLTTQSAGPKILWIRENEPEVYERTHRFTTSQSFLVHRLTGRWVMDHGTAAYYHPLYDLGAGGWYEPWFDGIVEADKLPELGWAHDIAGTVTPQAAAITGLRAGTPVIVGATDAPAEAVSAGVTAPGRVMVMYGSTIFMIAVLDKPAPTEVLWSAPYVFPGTYVLAGGTATAGTVTHWLRDLVTTVPGQPPAFSELATEAAASPPGANGLLVLPYFSGERTPINDPGARGIIAGLDLTHTRGHVFRAVLEGIANSVAANLESFAAHGARPDQIRAVGGGTRNEVWTQATADASGLTQQVVAGSGASFGDAALAALGIGVLDGPEAVDRWVGIEREVHPRPEYLDLYATQRRRAHELYTRTRPLLEPEWTDGTR